ncbi:hypothetical protein WR25_07736 [Diploscapter pachys]|uniref:Frizzled-4 n=1 Tax=Diploscapter pachys TaxID=2018661 RepID=A0A2A2L464_9BILA|nr:hypothetical protein WR25_07736 [Diploscapter pachys]
MGTLQLLPIILIFSTVPQIFSQSHKTCEPITIPLCKGVGYNLTSFPNSLDHEKQEDAGLEVHQFYPLVEVGCYKHLKFFLCTLYAPLCQENYDLSIQPCMEMCLEAKKRCSPLMHKYGFRWPETLSCDKLPKLSDQRTTGVLCAAPPDTEIAAPAQPPTLVVPEVGISFQDYSEESGSCRCRCSSPFRPVPIARSMVWNVSGCAYPCYASSLKENKQLMTNWMATWSIICFVLSAFTFLTFLIETDRFQYPERPIFMLAFCQMMVAVGFIIRVVVGHEEIACDSYRIKGAEDGNGSLCFLVLNSIDGDPVTGLCYVGNTDASSLRTLVLAPLVLYFSLGVLFLAIGFFNLWSIRNEVQKQHPGLDNASKLTQLMSKIGIFSVLYTLPAFLVILVLFYEQYHRPQWEQASLCPCAQRNNISGDSSLFLGMIRTACMCIVGWTSGVWVFSSKTLASWRNFICCLGRASGTAKYEPADLIYAKSDISCPNFYNPGLRHPSNHMYGALPEKL